MSRQLVFRAGFHVALTAGRLQVATMNLRPGGKEGGPDNIHRGAEQWVLVVAGTGRALLDGRRRVLRAGTLLRIPKGVPHEIRNTGRTLLKTVNIYTPPAYRPDGEPLPAGRKRVGRTS
jgi:mannose-6-phosphate isomerase-like protein (cupin superfamily)